MNTKVVSLSLGLVFVVIFAVCFIWDIILPGYAMIGAKNALLPGYTGLNLSNFIIGMTETFLYGIGIGVLFVWVYNNLSEKIA